MTETNALKGYICPKCNWSDVYAADICPRCHSTAKETAFSTNGKIATFTVIRYPPEGFQLQIPSIIALIDLENGPRVMGRIATNLGNVQVGLVAHFVRNHNGALEFTI